VVLPHSEGMKAHLVREFGLFEELAQHLGVRDGVSVGEDPDVAERVQSEQYTARADRRCGICR
jgi:putative hemolysin